MLLQQTRISHLLLPTGCLTVNHIYPSSCTPLTYTQGKRNTSLAFFTSHERSLLKSNWGSQATRLSRDSFLPFASCRLCLQIARDPVACASHGDIFCRECVFSNLLAQRKELKRLEKEDERRRKEEEEVEKEKGNEEKERAVKDFEKVMMGLEGGGKKPSNGSKQGADVVEPLIEGRGVKRKFELDEEEMLKNAKEERAKARKALDDEKVFYPCYNLAYNFSADNHITKVLETNPSLLLDSISYPFGHEFNPQNPKTIPPVSCLIQHKPAPPLPESPHLRRIQHIIRVPQFSSRHSSRYLSTRMPSLQKRSK